MFVLKPLLFMAGLDGTHLQDGDLYLVSHDNKPKHDKAAGYLLPRLGVVNAKDGTYSAVEIEENDPLALSKDLESLKRLRNNEYVTCESKGGCFHFEIERNEEGMLSASTKKKFNLPVPEDRFYNIEAIAFREMNQPGFLQDVLPCGEELELCWSHRGGIYAGEEPWTRCGLLDIESGTISTFSETPVEDPFGIPNKLNRAISDHAIGSTTGTDYFMATIDTEGSEGIEATNDQAYSFLYTKDKCLGLFPGEKAEALHLDDQETTAVFATDNEHAGSDICNFNLRSGSLNCIHVHDGEEYGIGGIAPIKV